MSGEENGVKQFKRGELLFEENQKAEAVYLIQKGQVQAYLQRGPHRIELITYNAPQIVGEQAIFGQKTYGFSAAAAANSTVVVAPVSMIQQQYSATTAPLKLLLKSLAESLKVTTQTIKAARLEEDRSPCPQMLVARLFSALSYTCHRFGAEENGQISVTWGALRNTTIRFYLESAQRMTGILQILTKLKLADLVYVTNEDDEQELTNVRIKNLGVIDGFADFYAGELYKKGRSEIIYVDRTALSVVRGLCAQTSGLEEDFRGATKLRLDEVIEYQKSHFGIQFKQNDVDLLKNKGLFIDQKTSDEGIMISFDRHEFDRIRCYWEIIQELDRWNERGKVLMEEPQEKKAATDQQTCPECNKEVASDAKFCSYCGHKLA